MGGGGVGMRLPRVVAGPLYRCPQASVRPAVPPDWNAAASFRRTTSRSPPSLAEVFAAAISPFTSIASEISEAASSRGLASSQQAKVTTVVTVEIVLAALKHNSRFIVP